MFLLYVDESGDPGPLHPHASAHYILSALIVPMDGWHRCLDRLRAFRGALHMTYGLKPRTEIHAAELIRVNKTQEYKQIHKGQRIQILRDYAIEIPVIFSRSRIINVCFTKADSPTRPEYQTVAWTRLIQRYDTFLKKEGNAGGIIIADQTNDRLVRQLLRRMRRYNPVTSQYAGYYNAPTDNIVEDIIPAKSSDSYFIQSVDVIAHLLYRKEFPKAALKKHGVDKLFDHFEPLLLKAASRRDALGIVRT